MCAHQLFNFRRIFNPLGFQYRTRIGRQVFMLDLLMVDNERVFVSLHSYFRSDRARVHQDPIAKFPVRIYTSHLSLSVNAFISSLLRLSKSDMGNFPHMALLYKELMSKYSWFSPSFCSSSGFTTPQKPPLIFWEMIEDSSGSLISDISAWEYFQKTSYEKLGKLT